MAESAIAQLNALIEQVRVLNQQVDSNTTQVSYIHGIHTGLEQAKLNIQQMQTESNSGGGFKAGGAPEFLVHPKDMKVHEFTGDAKHIRDFLEDSVDYANVVAHHIAEAMEWVETQEGEI